MSSLATDYIVEYVNDVIIGEQVFHHDFSVLQPPLYHYPIFNAIQGRPINGGVDIDITKEIHFPEIEVWDDHRFMVAERIKNFYTLASVNAVRKALLELILKESKWPQYGGWNGISGLKAGPYIEGNMDPGFYFQALLQKELMGYTTTSNLRDCLVLSNPKGLGREVGHLFHVTYEDEIPEDEIYLSHKGALNYEYKGFDLKICPSIGVRGIDVWFNFKAKVQFSGEGVKTGIVKKGSEDA